MSRTTRIPSRAPAPRKARSAEGPWRPRPADTSGVAIPAEIAALTELLARNTHETWAAGRIAEGWRHGPVRDEATKEHPGLVPYDELPESEKDYDRRTAVETVRLILSLGYRIVSR